MFDLEARADEPDADLGRRLEVGVVDDLDRLDAGAALDRPAFGSMTNAQTLSRGAAMSTVPSKCIGGPHQCASGGWIGSSRIRYRFLDEAGAAADRAEGVDDPVVLGQVPGVGAVDGHPAHRVGQHDVVDDGLEGDVLGQPGGDGRRAGRGHEVRPAAADLDELGEDGQGDLLGRLGAEVEAGRGAQRGDRARRRWSSPRAATRARRRPGSARRRARRTTPPGSGPARRPPRPRCPGWRRRRTAQPRDRARGCRPRRGPARRPGRRRARRSDR